MYKTMLVPFFLDTVYIISAMVITHVPAALGYFNNANFTHKFYAEA